MTRVNLLEGPFLGFWHGSLMHAELARNTVAVTRYINKPPTHPPTHPVLLHATWLQYCKSSEEYFLKRANKF